MKYTNQELDELFESSKLDNTIFVGSQIRQLVGMIRDLQKPELTVREAFEKAFGKVPDGAMCHIGAGGKRLAWFNGPIIRTAGKWPVYSKLKEWDFREKQWVPIQYNCLSKISVGPDISNDQAESFRGFFGAAYDAVLNGEK